MSVAPPLPIGFFLFFWKLPPLALPRLLVGDLDPVSYLKSVLMTSQGQKSSVAWRGGGGSALGISSNTPPTRSAAVWRVKSVPFGWSEEDLLNILHDAGWTDLSVVAYPTRKIRPWLLKCKPPDSLDGSVAPLSSVAFGGMHQPDSAGGFCGPLNLWRNNCSGF